MELLRQIFGAVLLFMLVGIPLAIFMGLTDSPNTGTTGWLGIAIITALTFYPVAIGLVFYAMNWTFISIPPPVFLGLVSILPVIFGLLIIPRLIYNRVNHIDPRVKIQDGVLYANQTAIPGADAATFKILKDAAYTKDSRHVYYKGQLMDDVDPTQFHSFATGPGQEMYRDDKGIFYGAGRIANADSETFRRLSYSYFRDAKHIFALNETQDRIVLLEGADTPTFETLTASKNTETLYAKDKNAVYYQGIRIPDADPQTFELANNISAEGRDKNHLYTFGKVVPKK